MAARVFAFKQLFARLDDVLSGRVFYLSGQAARGLPARLSPEALDVVPLNPTPVLQYSSPPPPPSPLFHQPFFFLTLAFCSRYTHLHHLELLLLHFALLVSYFIKMVHLATFYLALAAVTRLGVIANSTTLDMGVVFSANPKLKTLAKLFSIDPDLFDASQDPVDTTFLAPSDEAFREFLRVTREFSNLLYRNREPANFTRWCVGFPGEQGYTIPCFQGSHELSHPSRELHSRRTPRRRHEDSSNQAGEYHVRSHQQHEPGCPYHPGKWHGLHLRWSQRTHLDHRYSTSLFLYTPAAS